VGTKVCRACGETKPATDEFFYRDGSPNKYYLRRICKKCKLQRETERYYKTKYGHLPGGGEAQQMRNDTLHCQICGATNSLCVDHSHSKQYVRGVICTNCNLGLGHFKDDPSILESAIEYVIASDSHHDKRDRE
jgi:5-methylcytosine-specific restriction endonuclease McrA